MAYVKKDRTENIEEINEVLKEYGKQDIRIGQAINNAMNGKRVSLYNIENDDLLTLLKEGLEPWKK